MRDTVACMKTHSWSAVELAFLSFFFLAVLQGMCDLSSLKGTESMLPAMEAWSLNHWPTRELPWSWHLSLGLTDFKCHALSLPCPGDQKSVSFSPAAIKNQQA